MPEFSKHSKERLATCDPRLQLLFNEVVKIYDCAIICGHRNEVDQEKAFHDGFSHAHWPNGNHNKLPSLAVDVMPSPVDWTKEGDNKVEAFAVLVKDVALNLNIEVEWGGSWKFLDTPHWQVKL